MSFRDHFSAVAEAYARYRPGYPPAVFTFLAGRVPVQERAWDAGTGNGQAALGLARHFDEVVATDASARQIEQAVPHPRITYRVEPAERTTLAGASVDLVTVAQALHWFDLDRFYAEVRRVTRPHAVLAVLAYAMCRVAPAVDAVVDRYYRKVLDAYWPPERAYYLRGYDVPFPFALLETPSFVYEVDWDLATFLGYLGTWSAARRYVEDRGEDPRGVIRRDLAEAWGEPGAIQRVRWPLILKVARVHAG
ncbi:MAG: SAM-dependent methyltransferase [Rhodothermaceae bacterium]|nr:MAG: SAM-dependent methyltransferase [Rhodothermaceae bacterium]